MNTVLTDLIPEKARKYVYGLLFLVAFGYGLWQANDHDWNAVIAAALPIVVGALAVSNTDVKPDASLGDGCFNEHSPGSNPDCIYNPDPDEQDPLDFG